MRLNTLSRLSFLLATIDKITAFWRLPCAGPVVTERIDPVVSPGKVSGHVHAIMGASNINYTTTYEDLRASECTSCQVSQDLSAYWVPAMYWHDKTTGLFTSLQQYGGMLAYYIQRYQYTGEQLYAFPNGFRMLAGNPSVRSDQGTLASQAISYHCLDYADNSDAPETGYFPNITCPNGLRQQIFFPSCWDGVNVDSSDHKSHVAYPSNEDSGICPSSHPYRLVSLFYEVIWWTLPYAEQFEAGTGEFTLANGDPTGYSSHADFVSGWDYDVLQSAVDTCLNDSGVFTDCPLFDAIDQSVAAQCTKTPFTSEVVTGTLNALPGNNPIQYGPGNASTLTYNYVIPNNVVLNPSLGLSDLSIRNSSQFPTPISITSKGCYADGYPLSRTMGGLGPYGIFQVASMTNQLCSSYCLAQGFAFSGSEYADECFCSNALPPTALPSSSCNMPCSGDSTQMCGGNNALSVYYNAAGASLVSKSASTTTSVLSASATGYTTSGTCNGASFTTGQYVCWGGVQLCQIANGVVYHACSGACYNPAQYSCPNGFLQPASATTTSTATAAKSTSTSKSRVPITASRVAITAKAAATATSSTTKLNLSCLLFPSYC